MNTYQLLNEEELVNIDGGIEPITIAIGLGSLAIASFGAGYKFGSDLAKRGRK